MKHPHWDLVLDHIASGDLDDAMPPALGSDTGSDYLRRWMRCAMRGIKVPYLFLWGPQASGKSMLVKAMEILLPGEVVLDMSSLTPFNKYLANAKVVYRDEEPTSEAGMARWSEYVNSENLTILRTAEELQVIPNRMNFIHTSFNRRFCPFDTVKPERLMALYVPQLDPAKQIYYPELIEQLKLERDAFVLTLLHVPASDNLPRIITPSLLQAIKKSLTSR